MTDFAQAFTIGIEAAKTAERMKKEIEDVFYELNQQISKATGGKIRIEIGEHSLSRFGRDVIKAIPFSKDYDFKILAHWDQDPAGYPCRISWRDKDIWCEDREALENTLTELLQDPVVGEKLYSLLKKENQEDDQEIPPGGPMQKEPSDQHSSL